MKLSEELSSAVRDVVPWDLVEARGMGSYAHMTPGVEPYFPRGKEREPAYPGLTGPRHEAALKKGYVDLGLVSAANAAHLRADSLGAMVARMMASKKGDGFIRDPEDVLGAIGMSLDDVEKGIKRYFEREWTERSILGSEAEDPEAATGWHNAAQAVKKAAVSIKPIKGKTGAGYQITMRPSPQEILKGMGEP